MYCPDHNIKQHDSRRLLEQQQQRDSEHRVGYGFCYGWRYAGTGNHYVQHRLRL